MEETNEIIIYQSEDGATHIDVKFTGETVWLSQQQMSELYQTSRSNVVEHIKHIYEDHELDEDSTCRDFRQVRQEDSRQVTREIPFYNLDMIISLGYRIRSVTATHFRRSGRRIPTQSNRSATKQKRTFNALSEYGKIRHYR